MPNRSSTRQDAIALGLMLLVALAIRLPQVNQWPQGFSSMRQYHSALIARAIYFDMDTHAGTPARRDAAADYVAQATMPEASIVEGIAAAGYVAAGAERLWIPRALSLAYWLIGALFLYGSGRSLSGRAGGFAAVAVFVFLPYAVGASLSFQPDSFAVMWMCASLAAIARYCSGATGRWPTIAFAYIAPAIFIRPMTACFLFPAMAVTVWRTAGGSRASRLGRIATGILISAAPAAAYFAYRFLADPTFTARVGATFAPALFLDPAFWRGWARLAWLAFGPVLLLGAMLGALVARPPRTREVLVAMWAGYALYGMAFNLHISTHPYYQTLAVPLVALSFAALVARVAGEVGKWPAVAAPATVVAVLLLMSAAWQGALTPPQDLQRVADYEAIGRATAHSRHVVVLAENWGVPLRYHADIAGRYWPSRFEITMYRPLGSSGIPDIPAAERLEVLSQQIKGVEYFAVADLAEFDRQLDLRALLNDRYPIAAETSRYVVYDLTRRLPGSLYH